MITLTWADKENVQVWRTGSPLVHTDTQGPPKSSSRSNSPTVCPSHCASFLTLHKNAKQHQWRKRMENMYFHTTSLSTAQCIQAAQKYGKSSSVTGPIFNKLMLTSISNTLCTLFTKPSTTYSIILPRS